MIRAWIKRNRFWLLVPFIVGLIVQFYIRENAFYFYGGMSLVVVALVLMLFLISDD